MTKELLAKQLNGSEYPLRIDNELIHVMRDNNLVVVYGYSDDIMCFVGAINDEVDCYEGGEAYIFGGGLLFFECDDNYPKCPYKTKLRQQAEKIEALWDQQGYCWIYKTDIPHAVFDVIEDKEKYCRGIIFKIPV